MSSFFLHNQTLNTNTFDDFKLAVQELMSIEKSDNHIFYRNDLCFNSDFFINNIYPFIYIDRDIYHIYDFFIKLSPCEVEILDDISANNYCKSDRNGFLGILFNNTNIPEHKKIKNNYDYLNWKLFYNSKQEILEQTLGKIVASNKFFKDFNSYGLDIQQEIISKFKEAISRNFINNPDSKIISNVSNSSKAIVLELRIYNPVAIRVYFNYSDDCYYLASIENKSNPNQNEDIKSAEKLLVYLKNK
jgi:hypothetical protein